jgi:hypothetical protein
MKREMTDKSRCKCGLALRLMRGVWIHITTLSAECVSGGVARPIGGAE